MSKKLAPLFTLALSSLAQSPITTAQYDNNRTGANLHEVILTPQNVTSARFGRRFKMPVDGDVYAQPLYFPKLEIPGQGIHDVVFVVTEHDSVYAFDAAGHPAEALWRTSFINPATGVNPVPARVVGCSFIDPEIGITPTPVIDAEARTIYVIVRTLERREGADLFFQRLHALDITTGDEKPGSPVLIRASVSGAVFLGLMPSDIDFNAALENPRAALLLSRGTVYIAWASSCDVGRYHGWVLAYDARTLKQTGVFNTSPTGSQGGIWQSDAGLAADRQGSIYAVTGNGDFNASRSGGRDYGDSVLKLGLQNGAISVRDYFTPSNESQLDWKDNDLGSTGPVLLPDQPGPHPHLMVAAGKAGVIYLLDRDRLGKYQSSSDSHAVQTLKLSGGLYGASAYWNRHLYYFGSDDVLRDYAVTNGHISSQPVHKGAVKFRNPGAIPSISANGSRDGIVWIVLTKSYWERDVAAVVQAYDAADVSRLLYSSTNGSHSALDFAIRFTMPTVANGRVYVGMRNAVVVYGLSE